MNADVTQAKKRCYTKEDAGVLSTKVLLAANKIIKIQVENEASKNELNDHINELKGIKLNQTKTISSLHKQIEFLEGGIQNEIRSREDVISKVNNTREICKAVEEHTKALEKVLIACQEDRQVLCDSYHQAVDVINKIKNDQVNVENKYLNEISTLKSLLENEKLQLGELTKHWSEQKAYMERLNNNLQQQNISQNDTIQSLNREKETCDKQNTLMQSEIENLKQALRSQLLLVSKYNEEKEKLFNEKSKISNALQDQEKQLSQREKELESLRAAKIEKDIDIQHIMKKNCELNEILKMNEKESFEYNEKLNEMESQLEAVRNERDEVLNNLTSLKETMSDQNNGLKEMEIDINNFKSIKSDLEKNMKEMQTDMEEKESKWRDEKQKLMSNMNEFINQQLKESNDKITNLETELTNKSTTNTSLMEKLKNIMDQSVTNEKTLEEVIKEKEMLKGEIFILKNCISNKNEEIKNIYTKIDNLQEECTSLDEKVKLANCKLKVQRKTNSTQTEDEQKSKKIDIEREILNDIEKITRDDQNNVGKSQIFDFDLSDSSIDSTVEKVVPSAYYKFYKTGNKDQNKQISSTNDTKTNSTIKYENIDMYKKPNAVKGRIKTYKPRNTK